jgi:hypothetical protein
MAKFASPMIFVGIVKLVKTVLIGSTWSNVFTVADVNWSVLAWFAVMIALPAPTTVIVLPSIDATSVFELV